MPVPIREGRRGGITGYIVPCQGGCGHQYKIAARTFRDLRAQGRVPICDECRRPSSVSISDHHRSFWQERFTQREIDVMAWALFGVGEELVPARELSQARTPDLALAASAARRA